jgi:hypothetical protein
MAHRSEFLSKLVRSALGRPARGSTGAALPNGAAPPEPADGAGGLSRLTRAVISGAGVGEPGKRTFANAGPSVTAPGGVAAAEQALPGPPGLDPGIVGVVADKVLLAWLRNRYQLLFPLAFDLRRLNAEQAELVLHAMIAAAQADGSLDGQERQRIESALTLVNPRADEQTFLREALRQPKPLNELLTRVRDVETGALVYAASLLAVDRRKPVNGYYLQYLAARLQLSDELAESLHQRFQASG